MTPKGERTYNPTRNDKRDFVKIDPENNDVIKLEQNEVPQSNKFPLKEFILLTSYAFFVTFNPSSPFLVEFFIKEKGLTKQQVYEDIFPIWTYSYFSSLVIFGLLCEYIGYKIVIIIGVFCNIATSMILILSDNYFMMQLEQVTVGMASTSFIIFSSYAFHAIPEKMYYQKISSGIRGCYLLGTVLSGLLGQLISRFSGLTTLFIISVGSYTVCLLIACMLPNTHKHESTEGKFITKLLQIAKEVLSTYRTVIVVKWAVWGGMWLAIHHLVLTYWQSLFYEIDNATNWNGVVSAVAYLSAACFAMIPTKIERFIKPLTSPFLIAFPLVAGILLIIISRTNSLFIGYTLFILYHCFFEFMSPIVNAQIAASMPSLRYGLIFSLNVMAAMLCQTLLQVTLAKSDLLIRQQFNIYGYCLLAISVFYIIWTIMLCFYRKVRTGKLEWETSDQRLIYTKL